MSHSVQPTPKDRAREYAFETLIRLAAIETDECVLWTGAKTYAGYGDLRDGRRHIYAHRLAYKLAHPNEKMPPVVRHTCDTPACVNPRHLLGGTHADNRRDAAERSSFAPRRFLKESQRELVRTLWLTGEWTRDQLKDEFDVSVSQIGRILRGIPKPRRTHVTRLRHRKVRRR